MKNEVPRVVVVAASSTTGRRQPHTKRKGKLLRPRREPRRTFSAHASTLNFTLPERRLGAMPVLAPHLSQDSGSRALPLSHQHTLSAQLRLPGHTPQASTAPLQNLSAKLVKARHCLHAVNLQVETIRNECDKARREVEESDTEISGMEHEEERLKLQYVESAPTGHYKRVSCYSRRAVRASPLRAQQGGRAISCRASLTDGPAHLGLQLHVAAHLLPTLTHLRTQASSPTRSCTRVSTRSSRSSSSRGKARPRRPRTRTSSRARSRPSSSSGTRRTRLAHTVDACPGLCSPPGVDTRVMPVAILTEP